MENIRDLANKYYSNALLAMEENQDISIVRDFLFKAIDCLQLIGTSCPELKNKADEKTMFLLKQCKLIREEKSYFNVYKNLTGEELKVKEEKIEKPEIKEEAISNDKEKAFPKVDEEKKPSIQDEVNNDQLEEERKKALRKSIEEDDSNLDTVFKYNWDIEPNVSFNDVAGLEDVKYEVSKKVISPLLHPELYEGYDKKNGGGLLLYGPPGTGKTMIAAAIANEIGAKFCCVGPSDLLTNGIGNSEKAISKLFEEARSFKCAIIFFDEVEALCPSSTHSQIAKQVRSELLRQMQGLSSYENNSTNILYLIAATNKPWDIDPAFIRPGRFGTRIYVSLPDEEARKCMIQNKLSKIKNGGMVKIDENIDIELIVKNSEGFNGADLSYLLDEVQDISIERTKISGEKTIVNDDFIKALEKVTSSVQEKDIEKILEWKKVNG